MNWITNYMRPRLNSMFGRREMPENLWIKCPETGEMVFHRDLEENQWVVPASGYHMKISATERMRAFFDNGQFEIIANPPVPVDPLRFRDQKKYSDRLRENKQPRRRAGRFSMVNRLALIRLSACCRCGCTNFAFMGGSLGMAAGEAFIKACRSGDRNANARLCCLQPLAGRACRKAFSR
jgi:acetyl-CoA carboxylase carboxyl transferase subunit beta